MIHRPVQRTNCLATAKIGRENIRKFLLSRSFPLANHVYQFDAVQSVLEDSDDFEWGVEQEIRLMAKCFYQMILMRWMSALQRLRRGW